MSEDQNEIKKIFIRLADGKSTPEERAQLLAYLQHQPSLNAIPTVEELPPDESWPVMPDWAAEAVLTSILNLPVTTPVIPLWKRTWIKIAAAVIPVAGIALLVTLQYNRKNNLRHYSNSSRAVQTIQLGDGTVISLNQRARLSVNTSNREVWLQGEAFFSVKQQAAKPFIVHASGSLDVTVLGTAFNVNAKDEKTQVVLNSGSIKVDAGEQTMILQPGEMADYNTSTQRLSRQKADTLLYTSWKYDLIAFRGDPLSVVMQKLGEQYGHEVVFDYPDAANLPFTGYLASNDLQQALTTLEQTFALNIQLQNNRLYVKK
ncbi:FecR family protein [Chitinophaga sp. XS-30]|uniref:FecR family protein n=1 Tax=Chitinophaga sp. XS-30 TaxID=2604421 RepID=UPI00143DB3AB|nr:FecR domain-containing protein [Chitinophaga sp. XS-30]